VRSVELLEDAEHDAGDLVDENSDYSDSDEPVEAETDSPLPDWLITSMDKSILLMGRLPPWEPGDPVDEGFTELE
jgi:hypothetical protein